METISQFPSFVDVAIGGIICVVCWVSSAMLMPPLPELMTGGFVKADPPGPIAVLYGIVVGVVHLFLTMAFIFLCQVDSIFGTLISSILATEIIILAGVLFGFIIHFRQQRSNSNQNRVFIPSFRMLLKEWTAFVPWLFLVFNMVLIIPSIIIGIAARLFV